MSFGERLSLGSVYLLEPYWSLIRTWTCFVPLELTLSFYSPFITLNMSSLASPIRPTWARTPICSTIVFNTGWLPWQAGLNILLNSISFRTSKVQELSYGWVSGYALPLICYAKLPCFMLVPASVILSKAQKKMITNLSLKEFLHIFDILPMLVGFIGHWELRLSWAIQFVLVCTLMSRGCFSTNVFTLRSTHCCNFLEVNIISIRDKYLLEYPLFKDLRWMNKFK